MSVSFDNSNTGDVNGAGTSVSFSITIGVLSNMAILIGCSFSNPVITGITCTVGGATASLISGTDSTNNQINGRSLMFGLANPPTGAQTVLVGWTTASSAVIGAISASGVNQATPFNNGTFNFATGSTLISTVITSNAGDLTADTVMIGSTTVIPTSPNQTQKWSLHPGAGIAPGGGGSIGPGTIGPITHSWQTTGNWATSGANFNQAPPVGPSMAQLFGIDSQQHWLGGDDN